jgi:hypothetical protein
LRHFALATVCALWLVANKVFFGVGLRADLSHPRGETLMTPINAGGLAALFSRNYPLHVFIEYNDHVSHASMTAWPAVSMKFVLCKQAELFRAGGHSVRGLYCIRCMEKSPATNQCGHGRLDFVRATNLLARQYITLPKVSIFCFSFPSSTNTSELYTIAAHDSHPSRASPAINSGTLRPENLRLPHRHRSNTPPLALIVPLVQLFLRDTYELPKTKIG